MSGHRRLDSGASRARATGRFGRTWWGRAWVEALEQRAQLDPNRLPRGIAYARSGNVVGLTIGPGEVQARVEGRERDPYQVRIRVRVFDDGQWTRVLDTIAARAAHAAAMLAGDLPDAVAADVAEAGMSLLPGIGEIGPRCTCPDEAAPCKHSAAACYLVAQALDADPFLVLLLRGRTREEVLAGLRSRRRELDGPGPVTESLPAAGQPPTSRSTSRTAAALPGSSNSKHDLPTADLGDQGLDARAVFAAGSDESALPPVPALPPERPGRPVPLPLDPPVELSQMRTDLLTLAADAARRAWDLATGASADAGMGLDPDADLARRADSALGTPGFSQFAARSGVPERELARQALAWRHGGAAGFETVRAGWDPATEGEAGIVHLLQAARAAVQQASGLPPRLRRDRITVGGLQVRLGRDQQWYPYRRIGSHWEPAGRPNRDPAVALAPLLLP
jgi:uncharacterized Zn finger protein